jgi:hypothetical protein
MKKIIATTFIAAIGLAFISSAQAMPVASLSQPSADLTLFDAQTEAPVIQVFGGCGWGMHRGPFGGCRPLFNCPRGWHTGPWGRVCRPN